MATAAIPVGRRRAQTAAKWSGIGLLGIVALVGAFFLWLNSDLGRRYVVRQINNLEMASGLDIDVGRSRARVRLGSALRPPLKDPRACSSSPRSD